MSPRWTVNKTKECPNENAMTLPELDEASVIFRIAHTAETKPVELCHRRYDQMVALGYFRTMATDI
jgi:hypothetical protein